MPVKRKVLRGCQDEIIEGGARHRVLNGQGKFFPPRPYGSLINSPPLSVGDACGGGPGGSGGWQVGVLVSIDPPLSGGDEAMKRSGISGGVFVLFVSFAYKKTFGIQLRYDSFAALGAHCVGARCVFVRKNPIGTNAFPGNDRYRWGWLRRESQSCCFFALNV